MAIDVNTLGELSENGTIGVVIPGYGHPKFLVEAVNSACTQVCDNDIRVVIVDDGCLYPETAETAQALIETFPGKLSYLRQPNTRLPGARNAGIKFLMETVPEVEAIFFLDADNRLQQHSLEAYYMALRQNPGYAWAYPDINFFGMTWGSHGFDTRITSENYSVLKHLIGNISEAGSLVHAGVFRSGFLYDETMKHGFEDWEFWLQLLSAGYRGVRAQNAGFMYRRRSESMLTDSRRTEEHLISGMRRKHADLYSSRNVMALEHNEAPAFAVVLPDIEEVLMFSDPLLDHKKQSLSDFFIELNQWVENPHSEFFPVKMVTMNQEVWAALLEHKQWLRWLFWKFRGLSQLRAGVRFDDYESYGSFAECRGNNDHCVEVISAHLIQKMYRNEEFFESYEIANFSVSLPGMSSVGNLSKPAAFDLRAGSFAAQATHLSKRYAGPSAIGIRKILSQELTAEEGREPFAVCHRDARLIIGTGLGMERLSESLVFDQLVTLAATAGFESVLVFETAIGPKIDGCVMVLPDWCDTVSDIVPLRKVENLVDTRTYMGREFRNLLTPEAREDGSLVARTCDWLVAVGACGSVELMGEARAHGLRTSVILDVNENTRLSDDDFTRILAYEHAINEIACDDAVTKSFLSASGVPPGKIISIRSLYDAIVAGIR